MLLKISKVWQVSQGNKGVLGNLRILNLIFCLQEFENFPQCRNLKLSHYFLKPIQRLPQYKLLLEDYLRNLNTNSPDYDDTAAALRIVTQAADHANETIKQTVISLSSLYDS